MQCKIVYADMGPNASQVRSYAETMVTAAKDSLASGRLQVSLGALTPDDVRERMDALPSGHERLSEDFKLILLNAGAMLAYAPYRSRILLTCDPFSEAEAIADAVGIEADSARIRLYDALLACDEAIALERPAFSAVSKLLPSLPRTRLFPPTALQSASGPGAPVLIVSNIAPEMLRSFQATLANAFPSIQIVPFHPATAFDRPWRAVIQLGLATSNLPGARLCDAWAGGVPVLQLVDPLELQTQPHHLRQQMAEIAVDDGKSGFLFYSLDAIVRAIGDVLLDDLPARVVARGARRSIDAPAAWDTFLTEILQ